jgi:hypothetical protein
MVEPGALQDNRIILNYCRSAEELADEAGLVGFAPIDVTLVAMPAAHLEYQAPTNMSKFLMHVISNYDNE